MSNSGEETRVRVLIADDHPLFAEALRVTLATDSRLEVVGVARDGTEAVELAKALDPDVVLMDISMPGMDGFEATQALRGLDPDACILILTGSNSRLDIDRARQTGASGYVTKDRIALDLVPAIHSVMRR
jgi:two-component system nitrate/nitrite response regulator NarL